MSSLYSPWEKPSASEWSHGRGRDFLGRLETPQVFVWSVFLALFAFLMDFFSTTLVLFRYEVPGVVESNPLLGVASLHGLAISVLVMRGIQMAAFLLPVSLVARLGTKSWLVASVPWVVVGVHAMLAATNNWLLLVMVNN